MAGILGRPRLRHGLLAAGLLALATVRAVDGDWSWVALFGLAAAAEVAMVLLELRRPGSGDAATTAPVAAPDREAVDLAVRSHRQGERLWLAVVGVTLLGALAVMWSAPSLAAVLAVVSLVALTRVRRQRRTLAALRSLPTVRPATGAAR